VWEAPVSLFLSEGLVFVEFFLSRRFFLTWFGGFGKGVGEILWKAANVLQNKLTLMCKPRGV